MKSRTGRIFLRLALAVALTLPAAALTAQSAVATAVVAEATGLVAAVAATVGMAVRTATRPRRLRRLQRPWRSLRWHRGRGYRGYYGGYRGYYGGYGGYGYYGSGWLRLVRATLRCARLGVHLGLSGRAERPTARSTSTSARRAPQIYVDGNLVGTADDFDGFPDFLWLEKGTYDVVIFAPGFQDPRPPVLGLRRAGHRRRRLAGSGQETLPQDLVSKSTVNREERSAPRSRERGAGARL